VVAHIRLHTDPANMAWIFLNVRRETGAGSPVSLDTSSEHVFCNSWHPYAEPGPPSQWLEEAMVKHSRSGVSLCLRQAGRETLRLRGNKHLRLASESIGQTG
jgi:hypothetical protein